MLELFNFSVPTSAGPLWVDAVDKVADDLGEALCLNI
jgi:hypothetical protein